jgi:large subunit ribosomal protein L21
VFERVPLIGTSSYTVLGRPFIGRARVEGVVESISDTEKLIVFKKKRRKGYKRSMGSRTSLTQCRITRIVHELTQDVL